MLYQGDDLINLMTVSISPAEGQELPENPDSDTFYFIPE